MGVLSIGIAMVRARRAVAGGRILFRAVRFALRHTRTFAWKMHQHEAQASASLNTRLRFVLVQEHANRKIGCVGVLGAFCGFLFAYGQVANVNAQPGPDETGRRSAAAMSKLFSATLQPSEEAMTLLKRADEGAARQDWKLVADCLQRMVELGGENLLTSDQTVYESARRFAQRRLAALPEEGRRAYRLLHDGEAAALLTEATAGHDVEGLRRVVTRYLTTGVGPQAVLIYADWLMDEGRFAEAAAELQWLQSLRLTEKDTDAVASARLAICLAHLGRREQASHILDRATTQPAMQPADSQRLAVVQTWLAAYRMADTSRPAEIWPLAWGGPGRSGRLPGVEPSFPPEMTWHVALESSASAREAVAIAQYVRQTGLLPIGSIVTDGRVLLTKDGARLVAVDRETFQPRWRSPDFSLDMSGQTSRVVQMGGVIVGREVEGVDRPASAAFLRAYRDGVGGGIALTADLALTIEWPGGSPPAPQTWTTPGGVILEGRPADAGPMPNRVAAYRLDTGELAWATDTAGGQGVMAGVQFFAVPIPVGNLLAVPARIADDMYLLLLKPTTGELARHIYLCGLSSTPVDPLYPRDPALADGLLYVPIGCGLLLALDAGDFSVVWASRYTPAPQRKPDDGWLPTPVLPVAGGVVLAPGDADVLMFFDRGSGEIRWSAPRGGARYLLAADDRRIWLGGGEEIVALTPATGKELWRRKVGQPRGRGVLAGSRLLLATWEGLIALDADSGEPAQVAQPLEGEALGNLWSFDGGLYSLAAGELRKYPDLEGGYERALAKYQASPTDGNAAIQLAALEFCKHRPAEALAALEQIPAAFEAADPHRYAYGVHLQVAAILELVAGGQVKGPQAMTMLERARQLSRTPTDALDSAIALGDYYRTEGRKPDAALQYFSLMAEAAGDEMVEEEPGFQRRARARAIRRLNQVVSELTPQERGMLLDRAGRVLAQAVSRGDELQMSRLAEGDALPELADRAAMDLAVLMLRDYRFESAEVLFRRVVARGRSPHVQAEAMARLAVISAQPAELQLPLEAVGWLERLKREAADQLLPATILTEPAMDEAVAGGPKPGQATMTGAEIAAALAARLDRRKLAAHQAALEPLNAAVCGTPAPASSDAGARPVVFRGPRREPLCLKRVTLKDDVLQLSRVLDGRPLWPVQLRLLGDMVVEPEVRQELTSRQQIIIGQGIVTSRTQRGYATTARTAVEGQTLVVNSSAGLHAVGLMTGRRLWARSFTPPAGENQEPSGSDAWLCVENGYVASVQADNLLEVASLEAGDRILWSRRNPRRNWYWVRARGDSVVTMDVGLQQVDVFELGSGAYRGTCAFQQTPEKVSVALFGDVICGPTSANGVGAYALATPGIQRWRVEMPAALCQVFKPRPDLVAISDRAGRVQVLEAESGKQLMSARVPACADGVVDGTLQDGVLYVYGFQSRPWRAAAAEPGTSGGPPGLPQATDQTGGSTEKQNWAVAAIRWDDGRVLWEQVDLPARTYLSADLLQAARNAVPIATFLPPSASGQPLPADVLPDVRSINRISLRLLDKATGRWMGGPVVADLPTDAGAALVSDVQVWPDMIEVVAGSATLRFSCGGSQRVQTSQPNQ